MANYFVIANPQKTSTDIIGSIYSRHSKRGGARPGAGRPSTRPEGARGVQVVLDPDVVAIWEATDAGERSALVNAAVRAAHQLDEVS